MVILWIGSSLKVQLSGLVKGRKYENEKYLKAKKTFNRLPNALHRVWDK